MINELARRVNSGDGKGFRGAGAEKFIGPLPDFWRSAKRIKRNSDG
jgi:hypothetical protein